MVRSLKFSLSQKDTASIPNAVSCKKKISLSKEIPIPRLGDKIPNSNYWKDSYHIF